MNGYDHARVWNGVATRAMGAATRRADSEQRQQLMDFAEIAGMIAEAYGDEARAIEDAHRSP